jgi:hypothetical protein
MTPAFGIYRLFVVDVIYVSCPKRGRKAAHSFAVSSCRTAHSFRTPEVRIVYIGVGPRPRPRLSNGVNGRSIVFAYRGRGMVGFGRMQSLWNLCRCKAAAHYRKVVVQHDISGCVGGDEWVADDLAHDRCA